MRLQLHMDVFINHHVMGLKNFLIKQFGGKTFLSCMWDSHLYKNDVICIYYIRYNFNDKWILFSPPLFKWNNLLRILIKSFVDY